MEYLVCADSGGRLLYRGGRCLAHQAGDSEKWAAGVNPLTDPGRTACEARVVSGAPAEVLDDDLGVGLVCRCRWHQFWARRSQWLLRRGPWGMELEAWLHRHFTREGRRGPAAAGDAGRARRYGRIAFALGCAALVISAAAIALVLAGCGHDVPAGPPTIASAARAAGCANVHGVEHGSELFTHDTAGCTLGGRDVEIATFASEGEQASWERAARAFGVIVKDGPLWAVAGS
jgi:hypothetical protein